tara:strand:+ start:1657 stop:1965 length:309 start_codon:yes stop_codon:yes gene_type:complete
MSKKRVRLTEQDLTKVITKLVEQQMRDEIENVEFTPEIQVTGGFTDKDSDHLHNLSGGFTDKDRRMLRAIFDTLIGGGANVGGYRGGRKRALPRLGDMSSYD